MASKFRSGSISRIFGYTCPTLHKGKRWYVDFFAEDPVTNKMRRKRYYISSSLKYDQRKKRAAELIGILAEQLSQGWNPWGKTPSSQHRIKSLLSIAWKNTLNT